MPPRKRTSQSKNSPSMSPTTSTSHADQYHHIRHTGPGIITRARAGTAPSKPSPAPAQAEPTTASPLTQKGPREKKLLAEVSPPGARTSFTKFMYALLFILLLLFGWYVYGMVALLGRLKDEVGWWGVVVGGPGAETWKGWRSGSGGAEVARGGDLEGSLNALADALGISPVQVASAVRPLVPQASLTSIASKAEGTGSSEVVRILFEDTTRGDGEGMRGIVEDGEDVAEEGGAI